MSTNECNFRNGYNAKLNGCMMNLKHGRGYLFGYCVCQIRKVNKYSIHFLLLDGSSNIVQIIFSFLFKPNFDSLSGKIWYQHVCKRCFNQHRRPWLSAFELTKIQCVFIEVRESNIKKLQTWLSSTSFLILYDWMLLFEKDSIAFKNIYSTFELF